MKKTIIAGAIGTVVGLGLGVGTTIYVQKKIVKKQMNEIQKFAEKMAAEGFEELEKMNLK